MRLLPRQAGQGSLVPALAEARLVLVLPQVRMRPMTFPNDRDCEHGHLRRKCPICERDEEIERLRGELQAREQAIHIVLDECSKAAGSEAGLCLAELPQVIERMRHAALEEAAALCESFIPNGGATSAWDSGMVFQARTCADAIRNLRKP